MAIRMSQDNEEYPITIFASGGSSVQSVAAKPLLHSFQLCFCVDSGQTSDYELEVLAMAHTPPRLHRYSTRTTFVEQLLRLLDSRPSYCTADTHPLPLRRDVHWRIRPASRISWSDSIWGSSNGRRFSVATGFAFYSS
ncbi:hypothetical protein Q1695_000806 [Nippostrongylus brasiliensis]|nr:hypothetical protein Q1695_000806 [Nippostrongylus brasiliensis]